MLTRKSAVGVAVVLASLAACTPNNEPGAGTPVPGSSPQLLPEVCLDQQLNCLQLKDGNVAVVYPVAASSDPSQGLLYWDAGGPGSELLDAGAARAALPAWTRPYVLVSVAEPWTHLQPDPACSQAVVASGATGVVAPGGQPESDGAACDWAQWLQTPQDVADAVTEIEAQIGKLSGVYASSFGAVRSTQVASHVSDNGGFVVLESPAPTGDTTAARLLKARWQSATRTVLTTPKCADCVSTRRARLHSLLMGRDGLSAFEAQLGVVGVATAPEANFEFLDNLWRHPKLSRTAALSWRQLARGFNQSSSSGEPSPSLVSYLANICATYPDWPSAKTGALAAMHAPCANVREQQATTWRPPALKRALVIANTSDSVVPISLQSTWAQALPSARILTFDAPGHGASPPRLNAAIKRWIAASR